MATNRYNDWRMYAEVLSRALPIAWALFLVRFMRIGAILTASQLPSL